MALSGLSGIGTIYMAPINSAGTLTGEYRRVGNAYPFSLRINKSQKKVVSRMHDTAGQTLHVKDQIDDITGTLTMRQWDARNLAYALSGTYTALSGTGGSVTDESITAEAAGEYVELANQEVSSVVVTSDPAGTTYVETTDYIVDNELGLITITSGGSISENDSLLVDYDYAAKSGYKVDIGTSTILRVAIKANIQNEFSAEKWRVEFDSVVLTTSAEVNFISDPDSEGEEIPFSLAFETLSGKTSPGLINGITL